MRILYDAGHTVTGGDDPRLGDIHVVLLSHAHGDHIGDQKLKAVGAGDCANSERVPAGPDSTTAEVAAAKNAAIVMTNDMGTFIARKVQNIRGKPVGVCPQADGATTVPVADAVPLEHASGRRVRRESAKCSAGRRDHNRVRLPREQRSAVAVVGSAARRTGPDDTSIILGPPTGYVLKFTNGLIAYLSGDTGIHTEMKTVVNDYHKANLAVLNLGSSTGAFDSGAYAMNELVRPASIILTHTNEAATGGGKLRPNSRTAAVMKQLKPRAYLAISGHTMEFDGRGRCVAGC